MKLSDSEIIRRRGASVKAMKAKDRADFERWYQQKCDELYWSIGQCCAGCDHWQSEMGNLGFCAANGIVPGDQVMASLGIVFCSYTPPPGLPYTKADFYCGRFKDDFDWSVLDREYLVNIGAIRGCSLRSKPSRPSTPPRDGVE